MKIRLPMHGRTHRLGGSDPIPALANPVAANELDYVEITSSVTVTGGTNGFANQATILTSNSLTFDGATRVRLEVFAPVFDIEAGFSLIIDMWDNSTDLGRLGQADLDPNPNDLGTPLYLAMYYTPTAGTHTFTLKGWTGGPSGLCFVVAGAGGLGGGGNPNYMPAWMRVST